MSNEIVLIRTKGNSLNLFSLLLSDYPGGKPSVGDLLPLMAERTLKANVDGVEKSLPVTYLCGLYEVVEVHQGTGYDLAPDLRGCEVVSLREDISGFGIRLGDAVDCPNDAEILTPQLQFASYMTT